MLGQGMPGGSRMVTMRAWARWAAGRCDLPKRLRRRLLAELENDLRDFRARLDAG